MRVAIRFLFGIALVAGIVTFVRSPRGAELRTRIARLAEEVRDLLSRQDLAEVAKGVTAPQGAPDEEMIRSKIDETRRRLQEKLDAQAAGRSETSSEAPTA